MGTKYQKQEYPQNSYYAATINEKKDGIDQAVSSVSVALEAVIVALVVLSTR